MKTIVVISEEYLSAVFDEVKKYSFAMQGYGSFDNACNGISKVNSVDLLGIVYLGYKLPMIGSEEFKAMEEFIRLCDSFEDSKKVLFVLQSELPVEAKRQFQMYKNVRIYVSYVENDITDVVIDRQVFGGILLDAVETYRLDEKNEDSDFDVDTSWKMEMSHLTQPGIYQCMDIIDVVDDADTTIENDKYYREFLQSGETLLALLRKKRIYAFFGYNYRDPVLEKLIDGVESDAEWCFYQTIMRGC